MKHFYLAVDAFDFHTPYKEFLAIFENNTIKNIAQQTLPNVIEIENIENYIDREEHFERNLYIVDPMVGLHPFHYILIPAMEEEPNKIELVFGPDAPQEYIENVMKHLETNHPPFVKIDSVTYKISEEKLGSETIEEANLELILSNIMCFLNNKGQIVFPNKKEEFEERLKIIKELKTTTEDKFLEHLDRAEENTKKWISTKWKDEGVEK